jgi:hypothetical protein
MFADAYNLHLELSCGRSLTFLFLPTFAIFEFKILLSGATLLNMASRSIIMMTRFNGNEHGKGRKVVYKGFKMLLFGSIIILSSTSLSTAQS